MRFTAANIVDRPRKAPRRPAEEAPQLELPLEGPERGLAPPDDTAEAEADPQRGIAVIDSYV